MQHMILGVSGVKGSGKSTVADLLQRELRGAVQIHFADALRVEILEILNSTWKLELTMADLMAEKAQVLGPLLQGYGSFVRRFIDQDYWVSQWLKVVHGLGDGRFVIAADTRMPNEVETIRGMGGLIIGVIGADRRDDDQRSPTHNSEASIAQIVDESEIKIDNTGSMDSLREQVRSVAQYLLETPGVQRNFHSDRSVLEEDACRAAT